MVLDIDATLIDVHSEKERASPHVKAGLGCTRCCVSWMTPSPSHPWPDWLAAAPSAPIAIPTRPDSLITEKPTTAPAEHPRPRSTASEHLESRSSRSFVKHRAKANRALL